MHPQVYSSVVNNLSRVLELEARQNWRNSNCLHSFEEFKGRTGETLEGTSDRFVTLLNELSKNKVNKSQIELNIKYLSILQLEWKSFARQMRQINDLNEIPLHEVYETLRQNEDEVDEILAEKRKGKTIEDTVALVVKKKKNKTIVYESEEAEADVVSDSDENEQMQQAMQFLTNAFQKRFYRNPTSNNQRYSSGPNNYAHKERIEGSRYEGKRFEGKRFEGKRQEEKKSDERRYQTEGNRLEESKNRKKGSTKLKDQVRNSDFYKNKMLLAKQQEAGKALMAEDEYWLDHSDEEEDEEEKDEAVNMCLMGKIESDTEVDSENEEEERENGVILNTNQLIQKLSDEPAEKKVLVEVLHTNADTNAKEQTIILKENSELKSKLTKSEIDFYKLTEVHSLYTKENKTLIAKLDVLEKKLYSLGQSEQTIHLNKPKKNKENWGIGYVKPQRLKKGIREVPALYDYTSMLVSHRIASFKVFHTKLSEEDEANEFEKWMKSTKVHAPFYYAKLNNSYDYPNDEKKSLSTDYFQSYSEKEMEAKPVIGKIYVPSLVLESKISQLENSLSDEKLMIEIQ
ncbi:hypothetical protein L6452_05714 [Arctium lappa]|uniref:Uncharacterized protein n=1 Tax=Arctium lappa TaxID=4217 RepID=A0ACB9EH75_ARCLA|nr:hypothetical protein L6452_05714 [Arctium lappa]